MFCPQCGVDLGGGARSCGACGWSAGRKNLWITIGCILAGLFLICCGVGTYFALKFRRYAQDVGTPLQVLFCRVQVVSYAKNHAGALPDTLDKALEEPFEGEQGKEVQIKASPDGVVDLYGTALRYVKSTDGAFEVRSAGRDKAFDSADDVSEKGKAGEDYEALKKTFETRAREEGKNLARHFGVQVHEGHGVKLDVKETPSEKKDEAPPAPAPAPPPAPAPAPGGNPK